MANWHALTGSPDGNSYMVVYHIAIANVNNSAGVNYRTALINSGLGGKTILPDGDGTAGTISAAEKASIVSGAIYEYAESFATNPANANNGAALQALVDARFTQLSTDVTNSLAAKLKYFGATH